MHRYRNKDGKDEEAPLLAVASAAAYGAEQLHRNVRVEVEDLQQNKEINLFAGTYALISSYMKNQTIIIDYNPLTTRTSISHSILGFMFYHYDNLVYDHSKISKALIYGIPSALFVALAWFSYSPWSQKVANNLIIPGKFQEQEGEVLANFGTALFTLVFINASAIACYLLYRLLLSCLKPKERMALMSIHDQRLYLETSSASSAEQRASIVVSPPPSYEVDKRDASTNTDATAAVEEKKSTVALPKQSASPSVRQPSFHSPFLAALRRSGGPIVISGGVSNKGKQNYVDAPEPKRGPK